MENQRCTLPLCARSDAMISTDSLEGTSSSDSQEQEGKDCSQEPVLFFAEDLPDSQEEFRRSQWPIAPNFLKQR